MIFRIRRDSNASNIELYHILLPGVVVGGVGDIVTVVGVGDIVAVVVGAVGDIVVITDGVVGGIVVAGVMDGVVGAMVTGLSSVKLQHIRMFKQNKAQKTYY